MAKRKKNKEDKTLNTLKERFIKYCEEKNKCEEKECRLDKKEVYAIFSFENVRKNKKELLKKFLNHTSGNINACDCIFLCKDKNLIILEILCGVLTTKELDSKLNQIKNCEILVYKLKLPLKIKIIAVKKLDGKQKIALSKKITALQKSRTKICYIDKIKEKICKPEERFESCLKEKGY